MTLSKKIFTFLIICLAAFVCYGAPEEDSLDEVFFRDFDDDSYFVTVPTYAGNYLGLIVGAIPTACVAAGFQFANATPATVRQSAKITLTAFVKPIGLLCGLPFKLTKVLFWDSPKYVVQGVSGYYSVDLPKDTTKE